MQALASSRSPCSGASRLGGVAARRATPVLAAARPQQPRLRAGRHASSIVCVLDLTEDQWEAEVAKSDVPVLVDFWATWCGPCKLVAPTMVWAEKEYAGQLKVVKVEADPNPNLIQKYGVYGLPTLIIFKDGDELSGSRFEGAITKKALVAHLEKLGFVATKATV